MKILKSFEHKDMKTTHRVLLNVVEFNQFVVFPSLMIYVVIAKGVFS